MSLGGTNYPCTHICFISILALPACTEHLKTLPMHKLCPRSTGLEAGARESLQQAAAQLERRLAAAGAKLDSERDKRRSAEQRLGGWLLGVPCRVSFALAGTCYVASMQSSGCASSLFSCLVWPPWTLLYDACVIRSKS